MKTGSVLVSPAFPLLGIPAPPRRPAHATSGEQLAGVIFTSPRRFHRGRSSYPENLVVALTLLVEPPPHDQRDRVHWLE